MSITVTSPDFLANQAIPAHFSGDGEDVSPAINWNGVPKQTRELAMIVEDPDAPRPVPFVHWVIYKIPPSLNGLPRDLPNSGALQTPAPMLQGQNDFPRIGYGGPAPPPGHGVHHYHFIVYALDSVLALEPGLTAAALRDAMKGHILAEGELMGTYQR